VYEKIDDDFTIRLIDDNGSITESEYHPQTIEEVWSNVQRYIDFCEKEEKKVTIELAMEYTGTPYSVFNDLRTQEIINLYFAFKQNPLFLFTTIETTPTIWVESLSILNTLWQPQ